MTWTAAGFRQGIATLTLLLAALQLTGCATGGQRQQDELAQIAGKTYVVTGASSGIGRGTALKLGAQRANVVLAARRTEVLKEVEAEVRAAGGTPLVVTTDVANPQEVERLAAAAVQRFGRIDVWINNAGVGAIGPFEAIPLADHARVVDVNLNGVIYGSHVALRQFRKQGHGHLVNIGSVESEVPVAYHASYSATKAGVLALGRALNEEIRHSGAKNIAVSTIMPFATDTPFFDHAANYTGQSPRLVMMDDPQKVADAIVRTSVRPDEEVAVGWKAKSGVASHKLMPDLTERATGIVSREYQMEKETAARQPPTSGSLHKPLQAGTSVDGGIRKRMQEERSRASQSK
ncbi:SDR family NAD(P)-dependent oxidoreductase [Noviherbaspirillum aridicola]|uniref:Oxidoreductase n=1 Tax=Noviherbaspirillum aridicola TaxID=2849687 RepID=A0ABQ4Q4Q1_9BURK|nr:SDR family NAD(P)-dependent oxidoreductase [Noviherbaspirillum aridicola]GIZ51986.1 oxidoreductase [Noviherbaspirillum aridicola]